MDIGPGEYERYTLKEGDLLVCEGGEVGRAAFWHGEFAACGYQKALHRLRPLLPGNEVPRFLFWLLRAAVSEGIFEAGSNPNTILHLTGAMLRARRLPFPDASEQRAIVDFLDRKASEIDALVAKKERLIELLQEKRSALVTQAVTKGLDPAAPMKDSGIPWLGELPAHWKIARMGDVFRTLSGGTPDRSMDRFWDGDIPWVSPKDMKSPTRRNQSRSLRFANVD
jgi:type I restriction enzyme S subunit